MAYESFIDYINYLAQLYEDADKKNDIKAYSYLEAITAFYSIILKSAKFRSQRAYCKETIERLNPSFAKGYFSKTKSK